MKNLPDILSLIYKQRIEEKCKFLKKIGLRYFVCYINFNNGKTFVLSNMFDMLPFYYGEDYYKEDNSFKKNITTKMTHYLCDEVNSVSNNFKDILEEKFGIFREYYIIRNCAECQFVFGAIKDIKIENHKILYKRTLHDFEYFSLSFVECFLDVIKYHNPMYHNSVILNDHEYRKRVIKSNYDNFEKLCGREVECLNFAALGKSSEETSLILNISKKTVDSYRNEAKRKLNAYNITHAVFEAVKYGYIGSFNKCWSTYEKNKSIDGILSEIN